MVSEDSDGHYRSRRRRYADDDHRDGSSKKRRGEQDDSKRNDRGRSREREGRRSRSPDSLRRSRDADGARDHRRHRSKNRSSRRDRDREEENSDSAYRDRRKQRSPGEKDQGRKSRKHRELDQDKREANRTPVRRSGPLLSQDDSFALVKAGEDPENAKPKEKPNFGNTGVLAAASNSVTQADGTTITLKYHEPPEARKPSPKDQWKLFVFKGVDIVDTIELSHRSCWLVGREMTVVDLPAEHPSISKQHAVIQFRYTEKRNEFGDKIGPVKPYLIDLESANGTTLNKEKVPDSRYLELRDKDMVQFGLSTREYVLMLAPRD